jgi:hypothetical protein
MQATRSTSRFWSEILRKLLTSATLAWVTIIRLINDNVWWFCVCGHEFLSAVICNGASWLDGELLSALEELTLLHGVVSLNETAGWWVTVSSWRINSAPWSGLVT